MFEIIGMLVTGIIGLLFLGVGIISLISLVALGSKDKTDFMVYAIAITLGSSILYIVLEKINITLN